MQPTPTGSTGTAIQGAPATAASTPGSVDPSSSLGLSLLAGIAPQLQAGQADIASAGLAAQLAPYQYGLENQYAGQQYQNQLAQLGLSQQGLGLQSAYNTQAYNTELAQLGLSQQGLGLQQGYLGTQQQLAGQQYGLTTGQQGNVGGGGIYAALANLGYQYPLSVQGQEAQAAGSGATNTVGNRNALGQLGEQYAFNTGNLQNQLAQAGLGYQGQLANFGYQGGQLGLQQQGLGLQRQQLGNQYQYGQGQLGLQGAGLGLENQMLGVNYGYDTASQALGAALTSAQDQSAYLSSIANQAGMIGQTLSPLGILQGASFSLQPNGGN